MVSVFICKKCGYQDEHLTPGEWTTVTASSRTDMFGFLTDFKTTHNNCGGEYEYKNRELRE